MTRAQSQTETQFQHAVVQAAVAAGWRWLHVRPAIGYRKGEGRVHQTPTNVNGWPDLTLWRPRQGADDRLHTLRFVELKTNRGELDDDQADVLDSLIEAGQSTSVWRPRDWDDIERALTMHRQQWSRP